MSENEKKPVEITAETITDYLSKLCKNTVSIFKMLETLHNDNLELKKSIDELKFKQERPTVLRPRDNLSDLEVVEETPALFKPMSTPNVLSSTPPLVQKPVVTETVHMPLSMQSTILPGEEPLSIKAQVALALQKKKLDNDSKELRCFQPVHQPQWLGPADDSDKILKSLKPDTGGLV